mmetsp:Transcript_5098/g.22081  ORF Transcript_5098/g.22081 Transcript_5098/m.22081 type:complete len:94 (-) Transcript_5098:1964-2245(-)
MTRNGWIVRRQIGCLEEKMERLDASNKYQLPALSWPKGFIREEGIFVGLVLIGKPGKRFHDVLGYVESPVGWVAQILDALSTIRLLILAPQRI